MFHSARSHLVQAALTAIIRRVHVTTLCMLELARPACNCQPAGSHRACCLLWLKQVMRAQAHPLRVNPRLRMLKTVYKANIDIVHIQRDEASQLFSVSAQREAAAATASAAAATEDGTAPVTATQTDFQVSRADVTAHCLIWPRFQDAPVHRYIHHISSRCMPGSRSMQLRRAERFRELSQSQNPMWAHRAWCLKVHMRLAWHSVVSWSHGGGGACNHGGPCLFQAGNETREEWEAREEELKALGAQPDIYAKLVASVAPSIWQMDDVKRGLLCQLFGGSSKVRLVWLLQSPTAITLLKLICSASSSAAPPRSGASLSLAVLGAPAHIQYIKRRCCGSCAKALPA